MNPPGRPRAHDFTLVFAARPNDPVGMKRVGACLLAVTLALGTAACNAEVVSYKTGNDAQSFLEQKFGSMRELRDDVRIAVCPEFAADAETATQAFRKTIIELDNVDMPPASVESFLRDVCM
jgi:hypothetical protein